jgi:hypothetical protein
MAVTRWAFYLGSIGGLAGGTMYIAHEAANQTETGLVSLGKLNRQLMAHRHPSQERFKHVSQSKVDRPSGG